MEEKKDLQKRYRSNHLLLSERPVPILVHCFRSDLGYECFENSTLCRESSVFEEEELILLRLKWTAIQNCTC